MLLFEPCNLVLDCFCAGAGCIAKFLFCLAVIKSVVSCKVVNGESGHKGLFAAFLCAAFRKFCNSVRKPDGKEHFDRFASAFGVDDFAEFLESNFRIGKDIAFAAAPVTR